MRARMLMLFLGLCLAAFATLSLTHGQDEPAATPPLVPAATTVAAADKTPTSAPPARDLSKLTLLQQQLHLSARRGADWLYRMNGVKGRFLYGYLPALKADLEGDHYLRQAGAAFALARTARYLGEERYAARATQAILTLLEETVSESNNSRVRHTALPSVVVNRLGAAGLLVLAINELPAPQADLLDKSEQLCQFIRGQARTDGSLCCNDDDGSAADPAEAVHNYVGEALYALVRSQKLRPAAWKLELLRKAVAFYRPWWKSHKSVAFVPWQSAAWTEAYLLTRERPFAEFVFEMNDWLCTLQYDRIDPRRILWYGGFMGWAEGRAVEAPPAITSAPCAEALAEACRATREAGDAARHARYTEALERGLQFVTALQYTDANTQHFADWYRPRLVGGFHASHQDGDLRIDHTQHAVSALVLYLDQTGR
jgi:hypothetical protein